MPKLSPSEPFIHKDCEINNSSFGAYTEIGQGSRVSNSTLNDYSYCDRFADIANAKIGKFSNIASFSRIGPTDHPKELASLHHFHYRSSYYFDNVEDDSEFFAYRASRIATIGHDTWVGHGAIIRPEVKVGDGAIVAAGAVVTKDVSDYMIVAGIPATPLRARFPKNVASRLINLAWWDWPHEKLKQALPDFRALPIEAFLEKYV
jgi:phosphonate metabolism protein (transferase hexapeptide repeat family)|tara:strand:+ start:3404 stop:4018 length:615 start_codon:yes stop_codon:yes gene_type:complete